MNAHQFYSMVFSCPAKCLLNLFLLTLVLCGYTFYQFVHSLGIKPKTFLPKTFLRMSLYLSPLYLLLLFHAA